MPAISANSRGIVALIGGMAVYTVNDALVKEIARHYPVGEVVFVRGVMTVVMIGAVMLALGRARDLRAALGSKPALARSLFDGLSTAMFVTALVHMPLANLAALLQLSPLILTALAVVFYRETVGWRRWTAIAAGFIGALFVVKPAPSTFDVWAVVAMLAATSSALRETQTRRVDRSIPTIVIAFMGASSIALVGALMGATEDWRPVPPRDLALLATAAAFVGMATYLVASAFRGVDISVVAPFRYSYLVTSATAGYLVFNEVPDAWSMVGAALIVGSGLYALHREVVRKRDLTGQTAPAA